MPRPLRNPAGRRAPWAGTKGQGRRPSHRGRGRATQRRGARRAQRRPRGPRQRRRCAGRVASPGGPRAPTRSPPAPASVGIRVSARRGSDCGAVGRCRGVVRGIGGPHRALRALACARAAIPAPWGGGTPRESAVPGAPATVMLAPPRLNRPCLAVRAFVNAVAPALRTTSPLALRSSHAPVPFPSACRPRGTTPPSSRWGCRRSCSAAVVFVAAVVGSGLGGGASGGLAAAAAAT